jgi:hypothetical protein
MDEVDVQQLAARVQRLEDIEAIKLLVVRYAQGADRGNDPDIMVPLFADTGVWDGGERFGVYTGKEAIRQFLAESGAFIGWTLHYMVSPAVDVDPGGQTARAFWYLWETANMPNRETGEDDAFWIGGTYESELAKQADGAWKFTRVALNLKLLSPYAEGWAKKQLPDEEP